VGFTHSAFRRLLADLGGCGAVWTEMLAARQILSEKFDTSPWMRHRPEETNLVYQLMMNSRDPIEAVLDRLGENGVNAIDLNLACRSLTARSCMAGSTLFENIDSLRVVLQRVRTAWPRMLTAKIRLGHQPRPDWQERFKDRLRMLEDTGLDAVILHPRFVEERFKRRARHELFPWAASLTRLPLIANGDITGPETLREHPEYFEPARAVMLGRMAVARPWLFSQWDQPDEVNIAAVWDKFFQYVSEDFPPAQALRRLQMFNGYFAVNFKFGHQFKVEMAQAASLPELHDRATAFFSRNPDRVPQPTIGAL
jgi:tRNA-dihydrouridine synthase